MSRVDSSGESIMLISPMKGCLSSVSEDVWHPTYETLILAPPCPPLLAHYMFFKPKIRALEYNNLSCSWEIADMCFAKSHSLYQWDLALPIIHILFREVSFQVPHLDILIDDGLHLFSGHIGCTGFACWKAPHCAHGYHHMACYAHMSSDHCMHFGSRRL